MLMTAEKKEVAVHEFDAEQGPVPAHRHQNGGGWVANTATVALTAYVGPNASVFGKAMVFTNARLLDDSQVSDRAKVHGDAVLSGNTWVFEEANVSGHVHIHNTRICGQLYVSGHQSIINQPIMSH